MIKTYIQIAPDGTRTEVQYDTSTPLPKPAPVDLSRYYRLKKLIRKGILIPREDFLFVKSVDHRSNTRNAIRLSEKIPKKPAIVGAPVIYYGHNTVLK